MNLIRGSYMSLESALTSIMGRMRETIPEGIPNWHREVMTQAFAQGSDRPPILPDKLRDATDLLRRARHLANRNYMNFDLGQTTGILAAATLLLENVPDAVNDFLTEIEPEAPSPS